MSCIDDYCYGLCFYSLPHTSLWTLQQHHSLQYQAYQQNPDMDEPDRSFPVVVLDLLSGLRSRNGTETSHQSQPTESSFAPCGLSQTSSSSCQTVYLCCGQRQGDGVLHLHIPCKVILIKKVSWETFGRFMGTGSANTYSLQCLSSSLSENQFFECFSLIDHFKKLSEIRVPEPQD